MSSSPQPTGAAFRPKKVVVPKVWKRPHSTIYGKNVEFGTALYSDKIGEINGRKFNSELPWHVRNSGGSVSSSVSGQPGQSYVNFLSRKATPKSVDFYRDYDADLLGLTACGKCELYAAEDERDKHRRRALAQKLRQPYDAHATIAIESNASTNITPQLFARQLTQSTQLLPHHTRCQLACSPYGQSQDGRKLSLTSISPHSYRPSVSSKSNLVHASDGEEFEFQDRSSPFYTDRWAGKTIRHFDSDLYSNANLFKSMIL